MRASSRKDACGSGAADWSLFALVVVLAASALDALEFQFSATRRVHYLHNFPDILYPLGFGPPATHCGGTAMAALSGAVAASWPAALACALAACTSRGPSTAAFVLFLSAIVVLAAVCLAAAANDARGAFFVHKCMYVGFAVAFLIGWMDSARCFPLK